MQEAITAFRGALRRLYFGQTTAARSWRIGLLMFDVVTILYFVLSATLPQLESYPRLDWAIGFILLVDYGFRLAIALRPFRAAFDSTALADLIVILSLFAEAFIENLGFLRVIRMLRLLRSYHVVKDLRETFSWFKEHEEIINSALNLMVFVFMVSAVVYVIEAQLNPDINSYMDALYFTVTTLTTTGYGDITMTDTMGRGITIVIMVFRVALFVRLIHTIFRPSKVKYACPDCGLNRHDNDAVHCKHCGNTLHIPTEGEWQ